MHEERLQRSFSRGGAYGPDLVLFVYYSSICTTVHFAPLWVSLLHILLLPRHCSRVHADMKTTRHPHVQMGPCFFFFFFFSLGVCEASETQANRLVTPTSPPPARNPHPEPHLTGTWSSPPGSPNEWRRLRTRKKRPALRRRGRATDAQDC